MVLNGIHRTVATTLLALALLFESTDVDLSNPCGFEIELFGFGFSSHAVVTHLCWPGAEWGLYGTNVSNSDRLPQLRSEDPDELNGQDRLPIVELEDDDCSSVCIHIYEKLIGDPLVNYLPNASLLTPPLRAVFHPPPSI
jgi:hypothetical protein